MTSAGDKFGRRDAVREEGTDLTVEYIPFFNIRERETPVSISVNTALL